jgi:hypothetical protein
MAVKPEMSAKTMLTNFLSPAMLQAWPCEMGVGVEGIGLGGTISSRF